MGPSGPVRAETFFALGQSGLLGHPDFFGYTPFFDIFEHRPAPLFP